MSPRLPRKRRHRDEPRLTLPLYHGRAVGDRLLKELDNAGLRRVDITGGIMLVRTKIGADGVQKRFELDRNQPQQHAKDSVQTCARPSAS